MILYFLNDDKNKKLVNFLKTSFSKIEETHLQVNYHPDHSTNPANFFYVLKNGRYKKGNYYVLTNDQEFVASAGWNQYETDTALLLTRAYISKVYRRKYLFSKFFLPKMFRETKEYKKLWITCNEYNIAIYHAIDRLNKGKSAGLFDSWPKIYSEFKPIGKKIVNYTEQYVLERDNSNNEHK